MSLVRKHIFVFLLGLIGFHFVHASPLTVEQNNLELALAALSEYEDSTQNVEPSPSLDTASNTDSRSFQLGIVAQAGNLTRGLSGVVDKAVGFLGTPYRFGGTSASTGFDCSGFVQAVFAKIGNITLPRTAAEQAKVTEVIDKSELRPGDLVFFNTMRRSFSHVGIYVGEGRFVHAPRTGRSVGFDNMNTNYWSKRFNGARRVIVR
jgi:cell wall-associated NlpC family hydrolase